MARNKKRGISPIISGVKRANNILITSGEFSSGIKAFELNEYDGEWDCSYPLIDVTDMNRPVVLNDERFWGKM